MGKRDRFEEFLENKEYTNGAPAAFFKHFTPEERHGLPALQAQNNYFDATDMDLIKIMFDDIYPKITSITHAKDWENISTFPMNHPVFTNQLELINSLVKTRKNDGYIFQTIFSPFVSAGCSVSPIPVWDELVTKHFKENPQALSRGLDTIAETLCQFVQLVADTGVDGFYVSVQGGEHDRFSRDFFLEWFKPFDLMLLEAMRKTGKLIFLHICGANLRLLDYADYPCDIVNYSLSENSLSLKEARSVFQKPIMGGVPNTESFWSQQKEDIQSYMQRLLVDNSDYQIMIGADCALPSTVDIDRIRWAVDAAHGK